MTNFLSYRNLQHAKRDDPARPISRGGCRSTRLPHGDPAGRGLDRGGGRKLEPGGLPRRAGGGACRAEARARGVDAPRARQPVGGQLGRTAYRLRRSELPGTLAGGLYSPEKGASIIAGARPGSRALDLARPLDGSSDLHAGRRSKASDDGGSGATPLAGSVRGTGGCAPDGARRMEHARGIDPRAHRSRSNASQVSATRPDRRPNSAGRASFRCRCSFSGE